MTVENTQNKMPPLQMGVATEYPFTFAVLLQDPTEEEALQAIKASVLQADGTEIELVYNTDYTVVLNPDRIGGTLTVNNIRTTNDYITIYRQYTQTQEVDYKDFNSAPAETFEQCFDKLTMLSQQQQEEINRSIKLPVSSDITKLSLPNPVAGRTLKWNESETGLINSDVSIDEIDEFVQTAVEASANATEQAEIASEAAEEAVKKGNEINNVWEEIVEGNMFKYSLFDTILKDHVLTYKESKGLALQGTYVYKEALAGSRYGYPDFYAKCLEEYNEATSTETVNGVEIKVHSNGHKFYDIANKDAIDSFFNTMGSAWFYGVDIENERIFLPRNNYFEQVTVNTTEVGKSIEAGLPNITGTFSNAGSKENATNTVTGAFYIGGNSYLGDQGNSGSGTSLGIDASRSSAVYGKSNTVQPNAVKKLLYICVGNTTNYEGMTEVVNQGMEILEQVNQGIKDAVDGQWISEHYSVASGVDLPATSPLIYDLSSYLPNDGYCYEVLFGMIITTSPTSNSYAKGRLSTDLMPQDVVMCSNRVASNSTLGTIAEGNAILPVGLDRTVSIQEHDNNSGKTSVSAYGYRRIGTNK